MRKFVIPISVTFALALALIVYYAFFHVASIYDAMPDSAVAVMEIDDWIKFEKQLNSGGAVALSKTEAVTKLKEQFTFIEQLCAPNAELTSSLTKGKIGVSAHLITADNFDFLFTIPAKGIENADVLKTFDLRRDVASVIKRVFKDHEVVDVTMKDGKRFSFTVVKSVFAFSFTSFLTENAVTAVTTGYNLNHDKDLNKLLKKFNSTDGVKLIINFKKADVILPVAFKSQKMNLLAGINAAQSWVALNMGFDGDRINFSGLSLLTNSTKQQAEGKNILGSTIWNSVPDNAAYINATFNDINSETKGKTDENKLLKADFKDWLGEAHAFVTLEPLKEDFADENLFIAQVTDESKAVAGLRHLVSLDGTSPDAVDTFLHTQIYNLKGGGVINQLFGNNFTVFGNSFFCITNRLAIFANNSDVLKFALEKISKGETLNKDVALLNCIGATKTGTGVVYINRPKAALIFSGLIKDASTLQTFLSQLTGLSIVSNFDGEWNTIHATLVTGAGGKMGEGVLWKTKLKTLSDYAPQLVTNNSTREKEIFTEDTANNIYLLSKSGEVIFTKNIGKRIVGSVSQLDYYNNGNLQYIFATSHNIFMIDRAGNDAGSYPLRLSYPASGGLTLVNNGSKYRYYVPCSNGAIYGYESTGKPLSGWSPLKGVGVISKPLQRVRNKNVELILAFNNAGRLLLLGSKGEIKWSVDNLPVTKQNFSVVQTGNEFVAMNASGNQLIQISADGNDNIKPLIDTAISFVATSTSDTSYQYFFSGQHDVRSYNDKGEFKNAISLKSSNVADIGVTSVGDMQYFIAKDEEAKKLMLFDLSLKPIAVCPADNFYAITLADLFDRKELIAIQPDANGNLTCYRIK